MFAVAVKHLLEDIKGNQHLPEETLVIALDLERSIKDGLITRIE